MILTTTDGATKVAVTTMSKPLLLLDIDGVVFPYGSIIWGDGIATNQVPTTATEPHVIFDWFDQFFGNAARCAMPVRILDGLAALVPHYELVWASLRAGSAKQFEQMLNLPPMEVIDFGFTYGDSYDRQQAKRHVIEPWVLERERKFAWLDDHCIPVEWMETPGIRPFAHIPQLLIVPESNVGLTAEHVEDLLHFAKGTQPYK